MQEIWIQSLGWEDPLEKGMATHSSILAWRTPWYCPWSCKKLGTRVSLVAQLVKHPPAMWETWVWSLDWEDPWRREWLPTPVFWPGKFHGLYIVCGVTKSRIGLNDFHFHNKDKICVCTLPFVLYQYVLTLHWGQSMIEYLKNSHFSNEAFENWHILPYRAVLDFQKTWEAAEFMYAPPYPIHPALS